MQNSPTIALGSELNTNIDLKIAQYWSLFHCTLIIFECEYWYTNLGKICNSMLNGVLYPKMQ